MPDWTSALAPRLAPVRLSPAREREIIEELSQHLDDVYEEKRAAGAAHDDAMRAALEELDEQDLLARQILTLRQASYRAWSPPGVPGRGWLGDAVRDVTYATRTLLHSGGSTAIVVLLLALGIGANTALFTATDTLLRSPLNVDNPDALVRLRWTGRNDVASEHDEYGFARRINGQPVSSSFSYAVYEQLARDRRDNVELFASAPFGQVNVVIDNEAELVQGFGATGNYFAALGVSARIGRVFTPQDDRPASEAVVVISSRFWQSRFGGDPATLGRVIKANDVPVTIVGVLPPGFTGVERVQPGETPDIFFPLSLDRVLQASTGRSGRSMLTEPTAWWLQVMGRLRTGASAARVQQGLEGVFERTARAGLDSYLASLSDEERHAAENKDRSQIPQLLVDSARRGLYDVSDTALTSATILSVVVLVILMIICANVTNLMLSRAIVRQREIAVRLALGASRGRLIRQLLTESFMLAAAGAVLGLVVAYWGIQLLPAPASFVSIFQARTFVFMALAALLTSLFFGAIPALRTLNVDVNAGLKEVGRSLSTRRRMLGRPLLILQVALSLVLLVGAGLFLQTVNHLRHTDVGFNPHNLLLVRLTPRLSGYDAPRTKELYRTLLDRLATVPGVRGVAMSQPALLSGGVSTTGFFVEGHAGATFDRTSSDHDIHRVVVSPSFLQVLGIPIVRGRGLTDRDDESGPKVAVINEAAAKAFLSGEDPIGRRFGPLPDQTSEIEIVGIARDAKYSEPREQAPPTMYVSYLQAPRAFGVFELRTAVDPLSIAPSVRRIVHQVDPNLPIVDVSTQDAQIERRFQQEKLFAQAYVLFGGIALLLASVGLFGVVSYGVARRTAEMGVRMALGAQRAAVVRMIMRESMVLVGIGVAAGLAVSAGSARLIAALLYGVPPRDIETLGIAIAVMVGVSAVAAYLPARRASRIDPLVALRRE